MYDVTSTYFEGLAEVCPLAQRGYSRDHRPDCKQVCIGLVVSKDGMPLGYEVFAGNRVDVTTLQEIVETMERRSQSVWVPVTIATLVPGVILLAIPFGQALRLFTSG